LSSEPPARVDLGPLKRILQELAVPGEAERVAIALGVREGGTVKVFALYFTENLKKSPVSFEADPWQVVQ
jgi:hypothetical protein